MPAKKQTLQQRFMKACEAERKEMVAVGMDISFSTLNNVLRNPGYQPKPRLMGKIEAYLTEKGI